MPGPFDFTGQNISNTYQRVVQVVSGSLHDGTGSLFIPLSASYAVTASYAVSASHEIVKEVSSSYAETASFANNFVVQNSLTASNISASFYYGDGSNLIGIETDPFPYTGSAIISGSVEATGSIFVSGNIDFTGRINNTSIYSGGQNNGSTWITPGADAQSNPANAYYQVRIGGFQNNSPNPQRIVYVGYGAGRDRTGYGNVAIGTNAGSYGYNSGADSVLIGENAGRGKGNNNVIIGNDAGGFNTSLTPQYNLFLGESAGGTNLMTGNVTLGAFSGRSAVGNYNTLLGYEVGRYSTGSNNILIGYQAGYNLTGSNQLIIANNSSSALITGDFANNTLDISGSVSASTYYGDGSNLTNLSIPNTHFNSSLLTTENISKNFNYTSSLNVAEITSSVEGAIIDYRLTSLNSGSRVGTFYYAHDGTTLSYNDLTVPGAGIGGDPTLSATLTGSIVSIDIENAAGFNFSGFAKKFNKLNSAVLVVNPNVNYLLDTYSGAAAAYSLRQLSQLHTGSAIRVREDGTNTETDIGFNVNGNLDTAAISAHCGANNGYVTIWYDQSGNGNDAEQITAGNQPQIYNGTAVITENGQPCVSFSNARLLFSNIDPNGQASAYESYQIAKAASNNGGTPLYVTSIPYNFNYHQPLSNGNLYEGFGSNIRVTITGPFNQLYSQHLYRTLANGSKTIHINGEQVFSGGNVPANVGTHPHAISAGGKNQETNTPDGSYTGTIQEIIIYNSDQSNNRAGIETNINNYYSIYDTGLLEDYPGAAAAYSVRQLNTSATSSMNIRRASDNTEQVIGFTANGDLDTGSIETFCAGTECYVDTWYDQSGNGNDAEQATAGKQPLIYSASSVITENSKPALNFDGSTDVLKRQFTSTIPQPGHVYVTATNNKTTFSNFIVLFSGYNNSNTRWQTEVRTGTGYLNMYAGSSNQSTTVISTTQSLHNNYYSGSNSDYRLNGTSIATGSAGTFSTDGLTIGARFNEVYHWNGTMQELIIWPTSQSNAIEDNINSYFNIY